MTQEEQHPRIQAADPLPSADTIPHEDVTAATPTPLASAVCEPPRLDDEDFPALQQGKPHLQVARNALKVLCRDNGEVFPGH
jgi:hypothetical protein